MSLPEEFQSLQVVIERYAHDFGLDYFEIRFEMLDYRTINEIAAYDGFPIRYPHWRFGMEFERLSKSYAYGLHRIYEMVINTDPCYAYLLASNQRVDQKLVTAHVYGHCDFFKNNLWFSHTNRKMLDEMANHAARIRKHIAKQGYEKVEAFLDACLSLDNLIDINAAGISRHAQPRELDDSEAANHRLPAKNYMDPFINPPEYLMEQKKMEEARIEQSRNFPAEPEHDILLFLLENAPLENWQYDLLDIVREEAYYFGPQRQTKIMNEGWASFVHTHIMTEKALEPNEVIDYADHHSGTVAIQSGHLNPYKLGLELYRDIEDRWNRGAYGPEYDQCDDLRARRVWDKKAGNGRAKVFEVRKIYNDIGFIDEFLTEDFAREHFLFTSDYNETTNMYEISSRDFQEVKRRLLFQLTNFGQPIIEITNANYENRGELYLVHRHEGMDLDIAYANDTLPNLYKIWGRPVHLKSIFEGKEKTLFSSGPDGTTKKTLE